MSKTRPPCPAVLDKIDANTRWAGEPYKHIQRWNFFLFYIEKYRKLWYNPNCTKE